MLSTTSPTQPAFKPPVVQGSTTTSGFAALGQVPRQTQAPPAMGAPIRPVYGSGMMAASPLSPQAMSAPPMMSPTSTKPPVPIAPQTKSAASGNFDDLWSLSMGGGVAAPIGGSGGNKTMKDIEREKASATIWNQGPGIAQKPATFGNFGGGFGGTNASGDGGADDLLL